MIKLIIGNKGSGKTKKLIDLVNSCVETSSGNVVCIENEPKLTYDISSKARLLETESYNIKGHKAFYGFLAGICAGNYDVTEILVDATFKIVGRDYDKLPQFFEMLSELSEATDVCFYFTISCDKEDLPVEIFDYCEEL
ncbi:MAG: hypothetical protein KH282_00270 [Clostridiales bacterium]|uniref:Twitching motility protein PilT n=1 Tax=Candidatus Scybalenecus merdavium TaxID=2840939 RepID=A0A9D1MTC7_9FIRM|nr:hypothetical protein [Clostridiales bacterium]HIU68431.1 hypothetical protein [Candidatus Scubalenecus merdavium]